MIHVLRDGRRTTASLIAQASECRTPCQWVPYTIALPTGGAFTQRALLVRYEGCCAPMAVLTRICRHCALDDGPKAMAALAAG